jgi:hypothetical protein
MTEKITWTTTEQPAPVEREWVLCAVDAAHACKDDEFCHVATPADLLAAGYVPAAELKREQLRGKAWSDEATDYARQLESLRAQLSQAQADLANLPDEVLAEAGLMRIKADHCDCCAALITGDPFVECDDCCKRNHEYSEKRDAEFAALCARLAEVEAERADCVPVSDVASALGVLEDIDAGREILEAAQSVRSDANRWLDEAIALRAQLAEAEAERDKLQTRLTEWTTGKTQAFFVPSLGCYVNAKQLIGDLEAMSAGAMIARVQNAESALAQAQQWRREVLKALELGDDGNAFERIQNLLDNEDQYPALEKELEKAREELVALRAERDAAVASFRIHSDSYNVAVDQMRDELDVLREVADKARAYVHAAQADASHGGRASGIKSMRGDEPRVAFDELDEALSKLSALPGTEASPPPEDAEPRCTKPGCDWVGALASCAATDCEGPATKLRQASPAPPPSEQGGEWTVCRPCRGTGVITGQSASADAGEG